MATTSPYQVVYQIYPRSFYDSNADGVGDLRGILEKIPYLSDLGVDAVWISPLYPSPMIDFGYDISDYCNIDPLFGSLTDFDNLVEQLHASNIKIYLDFVPNHTSAQHPWFKESRSSRTNPKRDWYIWHDPSSRGEPPNNWLAYFGGSAWEFDETSNQYYYHAFDKEQPDLNWHNPDVQQAMLDVFLFWHKRGVDGFRIDATSYLFEDTSLQNEPENPDFDPAKQSPYRSLLHTRTVNQPQTFAFITKLASFLKDHNASFMVTESPSGEPLTSMLRMYQHVNWRSYMPFNFSFIKHPWNARIHKEFIDQYDKALGNAYIPNYVLGNHDRPRIATRIGKDQARVAAMLQMTLRGTVFIYNGEELGMENMSISPNLTVDTFEKNNPGKGLGRDPERTPMQWDTSKNAGFSLADSTWLPVNDNSQTINAAVEQKDPTSLLSLYRQLISLRKTRSAFALGEYLPLPSPAENVMAFIRKSPGEEMLILLNFDDQDKTISLDYTEATILLTTSGDQNNTTIDLTNFTISGNKGYIFRLNSEEL